MPAVVAPKTNDGIVQTTGLFECVDKDADAGIDIGNAGVVRSGYLSLLLLS